MHPPSPDINLSHQVERIREIIVGRQMDRVERRIEQLETLLRPMPAELPGDLIEVRLAAYEQRHDEKLQALREEIDADKAHRAEEIQRLTQQTEESGSRDLSEFGIQAQAELEGKITRWLEHWNEGFRHYLHQREQHLISELRAELQQTRDWVGAQLDLASQARTPDLGIQASFVQLANAARAIAEAATLQAESMGGKP